MLNCLEAWTHLVHFSSLQISHFQTSVSDPYVEDGVIVFAELFFCVLFWVRFCVLFKSPWMCDGALQHQVPKKISRFFSCNRKEKRKKNKLTDRGIIAVDLKQIGKNYGLWEKTLLNIYPWQIRHSCVPYPDAAENSRMIIYTLRHSHEYEDLRILTKIAELTRKHYVTSENVRIDPENYELHTWAITRHWWECFDFLELFPIDRSLYFAGQRFLLLEVCSPV